MPHRIVYDGLNLSLSRGTGIATYTRVLSRVARGLGHEVGVVYSTRATPAKNMVLREISFFDEREALRISRVSEILGFLGDQGRYYLPIKPATVDFSGTVITRQFEATLPVHDQVFVRRNLFANARRHFARTNAFTSLRFDTPPDIFHCTYQLPLRARSSCNVYTIHDLVPLRLPYATLDNKRQMFRLLRKIAAEADHIVTVSECSRRDIIQLLGVDEKRVTNTYESVEFPARILARTEAQIAEQLEGTFGLEPKGYLLFFGALEPKKNVGRLIEAYLTSGVDIPLVLIAGEGWRNEAETKLLDGLRERSARSTAGGEARLKRRVERFDYVPLSALVTLIRGACAVVFPSLYEGFGLPVLEAMVLGTPVITSSDSSLPEVAGDAALLVDPYDVDAIARAITRITSDGDLRAELSRRGRAQAARFSVERYTARIEALYAALR